MPFQMVEFYTLSNLWDKYTNDCAIPDRRHFKPTDIFRSYLKCILAVYNTYFRIQLIYHLLQSCPYRLSPSPGQAPIHMYL